MVKKVIIRLAKLIISIVYYTVNQPFLIFQKIIGGKFPGTFVVLYYHEIKPEHKENFSKQMEMLSKYTVPVRADNIAIKDGEHSVAVTFDDAFQSVIENGINAIEKNKIPVTIFVPTDYLGNHPGWELHGNSEIYKEKIMTQEQLKNLPGKLITLGSHTCTHPDLTELDSSEIEAELKRSKNDLEAILGRNIDLIAFPHGRYNNEVVNIAILAGYRYVYTIMPQFPKQDTGNMIIGRTPANPDDWPVEFKLKTAGYYRWLSFPGKIKSVLRRLLK